MRLVGDVHGKYRRYREIIRDCPASIQVGDMGVGFRHTQGPKAGELQSGPPYDAMLEGNHRFIRGNHDNPAVCRKHSQWIPDGHVEGTTMFLGGGDSIDKEYRIKGYSWWEDEQLSYRELHDLTVKYLEVKPLVMITHEAPCRISVEMCHRLGIPKFKEDSITAQALQGMFDQHQPKLWSFGHWHHSFDAVIDGTRFICLAELEHREVNLTTGEVEDVIRQEVG